MRPLARMTGALFLTLAAPGAEAQARRPTPPPELKKLDVWIGDWSLSGTARDRPDGREFALSWRLHEHWVLDGFFMQVDQLWKGNGQVLRAMEMLSFDPGKRLYTDSGFGSDGSAWSLSPAPGGTRQSLMPRSRRRTRHRTTAPHRDFAIHS